LPQTRKLARVERCCQLALDPHNVHAEVMAIAPLNEEVMPTIDERAAWALNA